MSLTYTPRALSAGIPFRIADVYVDGAPRGTFEYLPTKFLWVFRDLHGNRLLTHVNFGRLHAAADDFLAPPITYTPCAFPSTHRPDPNNIRQVVLCALLAAGATIEQHDGIWFVTAVDGSKWDLTEPTMTQRAR
jgi:hypothetical protein